MVNSFKIFVLAQILSLKNSSFIPTAGIYYILSKKMPTLPKYWYPLFSSLMITDMFQKALTKSSNISRDVLLLKVPDANFSINSLEKILSFLYIYLPPYPLNFITLKLYS